MIPILYKKKIVRLLLPKYQQIYKVSIEQIPKLTEFIATKQRGFLPEIEKNTTIKEGENKSQTNTIGTIDEFSIKVLEDSLGTKTYTFNVIPFDPEAYVFYNLIIITDSRDTIIRAYIKKYRSTNSERYGLSYSGEVEKITLDGALFSSYTITNGQIQTQCICEIEEEEVNPPLEEEPFDDVIPNDDQDTNTGGGNGGLGGNGSIPSNPDSGDSSTTDGNSSDGTSNDGDTSSDGGNTGNGGGGNDTSPCGWHVEIILVDNGYGEIIPVEITLDCNGNHVAKQPTPIDPNIYECCSEDTVVIDEEALIQEINQYIEPDLTSEQIDWIFENEDNVAFAVEIIYWLENDPTPEAVKATHMTLTALAINKVAGPYDSSYYNAINPYTTADLSQVDPIWAIYFSTHCAILKIQNPNWSDARVYWEASKEMIHLALDIGGLVPVAGEVCDVINGVIYTIEGDGVNASLSFAATIPIAGWFATGAKFAYKGSLKFVIKASGLIDFCSKKQAERYSRFSSGES